MLLRFVGVFAICVGLSAGVVGQVPKRQFEDTQKEALARKAKVSAALLKGYKVLASAVQNYPEHRKCFSCHHQTLPLLALSLRDSKLPRSIQFTNSVGTRGVIEFTLSSFETKRPQLLAGTKIDGGPLAVGYGLWAMGIAREKPNETTNAMVEYLLKTQAEDGGWELDSVRPPASSSRAMASALAYLGLLNYGVPSSVDQAQVRNALKRAVKWNSTIKQPIDHEDLVGLIWLRHLVRSSVFMGMGGMGGMGTGGLELGIDLEGNDLSEIDVDETGMGGMMGGMAGGVMEDTRLLDLVLEKSQRDDGGWGQNSELPSDAYATGMALWIDHQTNRYSRSKGWSGLDWQSRNLAIDFLLRTQQEDGSWHVASRAVPIRTFFDNGDPHGKDQFVSVMATSWAVAALASRRGNH